jgi:hypothetical protein
LKRDHLPDQVAHSSLARWMIARVWVSETRKHDADLAELALAHTEDDKTKAAYNRADMLEDRRRLMDAWAKQCAGTPTAKVVSIKGGPALASPKPPKARTPRRQGR